MVPMQGRYPYSYCFFIFETKTIIDFQLYKVGLNSILQLGFMGCIKSTYYTVRHIYTRVYIVKWCIIGQLSTSWEYYTG